MTSTRSEDDSCCLHCFSSHVLWWQHIHSSLTSAFFFTSSIFIPTWIWFRCFCDNFLTFHLSHASVGSLLPLMLGTFFQLWGFHFFRHAFIVPPASTSQGLPVCSLVLFPSLVPFLLCCKVFCDFQPLFLFVLSAIFATIYHLPPSLFRCPVLVDFLTMPYHCYDSCGIPLCWSVQFLLLLLLLNLLVLTYYVTIARFLFFNFKSWNWSVRVKFSTRESFDLRLSFSRRLFRLAIASAMLSSEPSSPGMALSSFFCGTYTHIIASLCVIEIFAFRFGRGKFFRFIFIPCRSVKLTDFGYKKQMIYLVFLFEVALVFNPSFVCQLTYFGYKKTIISHAFLNEEALFLNQFFHRIQD